jgi:hypothetical protein
MREPPAVIALGGGAVETRSIREALGTRAVTVLVEVDVGTAWERVSGSNRPLAQDKTEFRALYVWRQPLYDEVADGRASDSDGVVLAAGGIEVARGAFSRLEVPAAAEVALDERVLRLHPPPFKRPTHLLPPGEEAKTPAIVERLWRELRLDRGGTLIALGGGGKEPRRRLPLAAPDCDRSRAALDAAGRPAAGGDGRGCQDRAARG